MNIDPMLIPSTLDMLHVGLALSTVLMFALFLLKPAGKNVVPAPALPTQDPSPEKKIPAAQSAPAPEPVKLKESSPDAAMQLLTLLQQDGRFIDFIQEDLSGYSDADVGAAARVVHEGSKKTLNNYFELAAIRSEDEESRITLAPGFNAAEVRLTGNVIGEAPFTGTLIHKGWRISACKLPKLAPEHDASIVAAAEVEL